MVRYYRLPGVLLLLSCVAVQARKRHLILEHEDRSTIHLSSFGLYKDGNLHVNLSRFRPTEGPHVVMSNLMVGFSIDRSLSDGMNPYNEGDRSGSYQDRCILTKEVSESDTAGIIRVRLNFDTLLAEVQCSKNLREVNIEVDLASKRGAEDQLSDDHILPVHRPASEQEAKRQKRNLADNNLEHMFGTELQKEMSSYYEKEPGEDTKGVKPIDTNVSDAYKKAVSDIASFNQHKVSSTTEGMLNDSVAVALPDKSPAGLLSVPTPDPDDVCTKYNIPIHKDGSYYQVSFKFSITELSQEGLYSIFFHNCQVNGESTPLDFEMKIEEMNVGENYLSAGEMPLPALYQMLSILFLLTGCFWVFILRKNGSEQVFRIHWIMAALVFLKSLSLFFHGVNYAKIAANGHHIETWAVLYYITHLIKGGLLFFTIVLIGSGWAFIKHILSSREKRVFMVILPLQVIANVAYIIVEESEEGVASRNMFKEVFILIDLICCGAILLPVVWSIKHLQDASSTDGKAAMSLEKLKLFRHFYMMVVSYIYLTRIIVYLLKITIPFQYSWFDETFKEMITFVFFVMTGYKFRPASNNPYFALPKDEDELEQILVSEAAIHEQVVVRKSYKLDDDEADDEETVVLFSKTDELSHELD